MALRKLEIIPVLFIISATILLCSLGYWQLERLNWKNELIANIEQAQAKPPLSKFANEPYRNIVIHGTFLHDHSLRKVGKPQGSKLGFYILTPLKLDDGTAILVNRGWAPDGSDISLPKRATVKGVLRPARVQRMFSPSNQPEKNVWFFEDMEAMSKATGIKLAPIMVEEVGKAKEGRYPITNSGKTTLLNNHLGYAISWFSLAAVGLIMFFVYYRKPKSKL